MGELTQSRVSQCGVEMTRSSSRPTRDQRCLYKTLPLVLVKICDPKRSIRERCICLPRSWVCQASCQGLCDHVFLGIVIWGVCLCFLSRTCGFW